MTEEIKYYTGNCITDLHTDTSISHCNEEKCKQYIKSGDINFCMSSVCPEKDCIYALVNKLHQTIDRLEQENKELKQRLCEIGKSWGEIDKLRKQVESQKGLITVGGKQQYKYLQEIDKLQQENEGLKKENRYYKAELKLSCNELDKSNNWQIAERQEKNKYRSALEEINTTVKQLLQGVSSNCINNTPYLTALSLIENKINEVLNA